jgi:hypothetical protein
VIARRPLHYEAGADPGLDRPAHVRAGSGLAFVHAPTGPRLVIAQDDASFLAVLDPATGTVGSITLDHAPGGLRQFDKGRGNKLDKLDLEACCTLRIGAREVMLAFGSGSLPIRERIVVLERGHARIVDAAPLYAALRARVEFAGSELNVEGAAALGDRVRLFQRGNGAPCERDGARLAPVDATIDLDVAELLAWLDDPGACPVPEPEGAVAWDLGTISGVRLTFTDAVARGQAMAFLAAAEASPDAIEDGEVVAVAIGYADDRRAGYAVIRERDGAPFLDKAEGLAFDGEHALVVVDRDDPALPSELCVLALSGFPDRP